MNRSSRRGGLGAALAALKSSLQWRIVLLWILATLVPTLLVATPLWLALQEQFSHSPFAGEIAAGKNLPLLFQGFGKVGEQGGGWLFTGYRLTAFSTVEEKQTGLADRLPWLLQERLEEAGADYSAAEPWTPHVVVDRNLYTGQNPASSAPLAEALLKTIG